MNFNLPTAFNAFDVDKDCGDVDGADSKLESVTQLLAHNPESINYNLDTSNDIFDLVHSFNRLEDKQRSQLTYLISSSFNSVGRQTAGLIASNDFVDYVDNMKMTLERFGYLLFVILKYLGKEDHSSVKAIGRSKRSSSSKASNSWNDNCVQVENCLASISTVVQCDLSKVFVTSSERDLFLELFMRPIMNLMEAPERMKVASIKLLIFKILSISAKNHGQGSVLQQYVIQSLTYYVHLAPYMVELLNTLAEDYDYMVLTEEILREISQTEFNSNDSNGPKAISEFLVRLSEVNSKLVLKQLSCISQLLDNSNQTLRSSVVETCGNIVLDISKKEGTLDDGSERDNIQIDGLINLLEERFLDQNPYVRAKAFQAISKILSLDLKLTEHRQRLVLNAVRSLDDRSTLVRRNAIKLLSKLVLTHQFNTAHGSQLSYDFWKTKLDEAETHLSQLLPPSTNRIQKYSSVLNDEDMYVEDDINEQSNSKNNHDISNDEMDVDEIGEAKEGDKDYRGDEDNASDDELDLQQVENVPVVDKSDLYRAKLQVVYYKDAVTFIEVIQKGTSVITQLLFSKNRNEALESMDFLVFADAYGIQNSSDGIRKMLHLVWMKGTSDEGKSVSSHLIDCYRDLFLTAPSELSPVNKAVHIAKNLIGLTYEASVADLASLEKLLCLMYDAELISADVIAVLWHIYNFGESSEDTPDIPAEVKRKHRGSIIILGMLALADHQIAVKGFDSLLNVGLGEAGTKDLILAKYTCVGLQRIIPHTSESRKSCTVKIPREEEATSKLFDVLLCYDDNPEWYAVAEQAVSTLFEISNNPDVICSKVIQRKSHAVFRESQSNTEKTVGLSQLLFIVGHVAIKTIVYLERLETEFKKKRNDQENKRQGSEDQEEDNELEMIGGTSEDDFMDAIIHVKERELLFGSNSLLSRFGRLAKEICSNNNHYDDDVLQRSAVLCMVKLMCVSSVYCEENLQLLLVIMQRSLDPIVRCNCVLGLGDMAVCFNNLVDESTDYIYGRLTDENLMVQKTCLMTVTFLILAGQVKVKGQLSSMAKCLENPDQGISDMCRLFFAELASKDNAIYNGFIDIFSGLSNDDNLSKDSMKRIIKFLVSFIDKEKQQKQLAEKLLVRLSKSSSEAQWNDIAYVLNTLPYKNENISQALDQGYKMVSARQ